MIIIQSEEGQDEKELAALIENALRGKDCNIVQSDDEALTMEELMASIAYNSKQLRIFVGRLERNTRNMDTSLKRVEPHLAVLAASALQTLEYPLDKLDKLEQIERARTRQQQQYQHLTQGNTDARNTE